MTSGAIQIGPKDGMGFDPARLREQSFGDLWRIWRQVGWAMVACGAQKIVQPFRARRDRDRARQFLMSLSEHELSHMGLTRQQVTWECNKPFWRAYLESLRSD